MRSIVLSSLALASFVGVVAGCQGSGASSAASNGDGKRIITGSVATKAYALDNAVVIASSNDGRRFLGAVAVDGTFRITVPSDASYRLALANSLRGGGFQAIAAISWTPGAARTAWMHVTGAGALAIGVVRPSASSGVAVQSNGGSSDSEDGGSSGGGSGSSGGGGSGSGGDGSGSGGSSGGSGGDKSASTGSDDDGRSEGSSECQHASTSEADLPYDVRPAVGSSFKLTDAFLFKGPLPAAVTAVTMDGGTWRLAELTANTTFTITQADCDHAGNRSTGRDRIFVTWTNADGSVKTDHLDLRYCDGNPTTTPTAPPPAVSTHADCEDDHAPTCSSGYEIESECDGDKNSGVARDDQAEHDESCDDKGTVCPPGTTGGGAAGGAANGATGGSTPPSTGGTTPTSGGAANGTGTTTTPPTSLGGIGAACTVTADCVATLACTSSACTVVPR